MAIEEPAKSTHAGLPGMPLERSPKRFGINEVALVGLVYGSLELVGLGGGLRGRSGSGPGL